MEAIFGFDWFSWLNIPERSTDRSFAKSATRPRHISAVVGYFTGFT